MSKCLAKAKEHGHRSISLPALGAGNLRYPVTSVARWMLESTFDHIRQCPESSLTAVNIVVFDNENVKVGTLAWKVFGGHDNSEHCLFVLAI